MKFLIVAVNASYSHTSLAVRALKEFVNSPEVEFCEFTINQPIGEIFRGIAAKKPDVVLFSVYIWNAELITKLIPDVKKILDNVVIGAGGPEMGFAPEVYLKKLPSLDFIMKGEGEESLKELYEVSKNCKTSDELSNYFSEVKGLFYRNKETGNMSFSGERDLICDLSVLPFAYPEIKKPETLSSEAYHKIYYYESSRGCPYSCSYCMSSLDKRVRFMPLERVYADLKLFLDAKIPLVKFVDRTYNLKPERYISIWKYILENHNGITMFHFEIEAEYLSEEALDFLQKVPAGVMQFEIGVQSANKKTLKEICRSENVEKLAENIRRIPRTIHQHLDLIAGLPFENLDSFGYSFDFVMDLQPDALQLGFLKVLHGTQMEEYALKNGWKWMENPVYETFSTPYMSYEDILFLKDLEVVVDAYWNSGKFPHLMKYIGPKAGWWNFFKTFTAWAQKKSVFAVQRRETYWFELMSIFIENCWGVAGPVQIDFAPLERVDRNEVRAQGETSPTLLKNLLMDLLRYDFVLRGKQGGFPDWYEHRYDKDRHRQLLEENGGVTNARLDFAYSEYEVFDFRVNGENPEEAGRFELLIRYRK